MSNGFDFLIYKAADEEVSVNAVIKDDTIWLTQKSMAELFEVTPQTITRHLANIYESTYFQINLKSFRINHSKTNRIIVDLFEKIHIIPFSLLLLQHTEAHLPTRHHLPGNLPLKL